MIAATEWVGNVFLLLSTASQESTTWSSLLEKLQRLIPLRWLWISLSLSVVAFLSILDIGDKLSGILGWLGVKSPFLSLRSSEKEQMKSRRKLLQILEREVNYRLENSLHENVKLDLYMPDRQQQVGKSKSEIIPKDIQTTPSNKLSLSRLTLLFRGRETLPIQLRATQKIIGVFDRADIQGKLLILGEPGSGKTTELLYLAKDLLQRAHEDDNQPIPLILELSTFNTRKGQKLSEWIFGTVNRQYGVSVSVTKQWLEQDDILLLLDGLDELGAEKQQDCIQTINTFLRERARYGLVVCCRQEEYETGKVILDSLNGAVCIEPLKDEQIQEFFKALDRSYMWQQVRANSTLLAFARVPLFLSLLVVVYKGKPITSESELLDAFIIEKLKKEDTETYSSDKRAPSSDQTLIYLRWLARHLENSKKTEFLIEDLQPNLLRSEQPEFGQYQIINGVSFLLCFGLCSGILGVLAIGLSFGALLGSLGGLIGVLESIELRRKLASEIAWKAGSEYYSTGPFKSAIRMAIRSTVFIFVYWFSYVLIGGIIGALIGGLSFGITGVISGMLIGGLFLGLSFMRILKLEKAIRYFALRVVLARNGHAPWNYIRFLDYAVELRLMQRVRGRYRFVHDLLRQHLANVSSD